MPRKERGNRGRQKQPSRESLNVHQGSVLDVVQEAISCLSRVPRTSEEDASQQRLLEQLQAFCHDVYQDDGLSDALALLIASGHLERILGSEA